MRGSIAAACAAVLMALAPQGALGAVARAPVSAAAIAHCSAALHIAAVASSNRAAPPARSTARSSLPSLDVASAAPWRTPSGPAPSQAPPA